MPSDLHYTRDKVARLRDEATPGPYQRDGGVDAVVSVHDAGTSLLGFHEFEDGEVYAIVSDPDDCALMAASWSLAADLLTLHDEVAALREQADRMRAMLLTIADAADSAWEVAQTWDDELEGIGRGVADAVNLYNAKSIANALRALAEVPR